MTDGMSENAREIREARGEKRERASPRADDGLPDVPDDETPREKVARLRVEVRLAQARAQFVRDLAAHQADYVTTNTQLRLRCTNLEQDLRALKSELAVFRAMRGAAPTRSRAWSRRCASAPAAPRRRRRRRRRAAPPPPPPPSCALALEEEELDPAEEEAIHAAELRARDEANALRARDNSPPPMEEDEDDGNYDVEPELAGYDDGNPADRKMLQLVRQLRLRVEQRAHREVVVPGAEGSRSDIFANKETFKQLTHRFFFDSANKLWGRVPPPAQ